MKALVDAAAISGLTVNTGIDDDTLTLPAAIIIAEQGEEYPLYTGNYRMRFTVRVRSNSDDTTLAAHRALAAQVFDLIKIDSLAADLSAAADDFTCIGVGAATLAQTREDRSWVSEMSVAAYCCPQELTT